MNFSEHHKRAYKLRVAEVESYFIAPEIIERGDVEERRTKVSRIVAAQIIPRLAALKELIPDAARAAEFPNAQDVSDLAHILLGPDIVAAASFVTSLKDRGLSSEVLFVNLLEPAARHLGYMWDQDECSFVDVTIGVGRLQALLAIFNCTHDLSVLSERRRVLLANAPGEQHSLGVSMVGKFLDAAGWIVDVNPPVAAEIVAQAKRRWYAVAGLALSTDESLTGLASLITAIRVQSCNPSIGIMVGGPVFTARPELVEVVGADGAAVNAPAAVVLAQKLFDQAAI